MLLKLTPFRRTRLLRSFEHNLLKLHAARLAAMTICGFAIARAYSEPNWAAGATLLAAAIALVGCELAVWTEALSRTSERVDTQASDKILFQELTALLEASQFIGFLRSGGLEIPFSPDRLDPMDTLLHEWKNPDREFLDPEIDRHRQDLIRVCDSLSSTIAYDTFPLDNGLRHLPPEWRRDDPERIKRVFNSLVDQSADIVTTWDKMVRFTRRRLSTVSG